VKKATKRERIVVATMISRMIGTPVFSDRTEYSVTTAEAFASMIAYAGCYSLMAGDKVIHHVEASWRQDQVGSDLIRFAKVQGERLTLRTPPMVVGGVRVVSELVWERNRRRSALFEAFARRCGAHWGSGAITVSFTSTL